MTGPAVTARTGRERAPTVYETYTQTGLVTPKHPHTHTNPANRRPLQTKTNQATV